MSSNICTNCGEKNDVNSKFCTNCGSKLDSNIKDENVLNNISSNNEVSNSNLSNNSDGTALGVISLILFFAGSFIGSFIMSLLPKSVTQSFSTLNGLLPLSGVVLMVIGRIKYPNNKFLKVVMWIVLISIIINAVIFVILCIFLLKEFVHACGSCMSDMQSGRCD